MTWAPARIELLRQLWERGDTAGEIASQMGLTRNAVLAKAGRLGLVRRDGDEATRFERLIDFVADAPLGRPETIKHAAMRVGLPVQRAYELWSDLASRMGIRDVARDPESGDALVRRIGPK